MSAVWRTMSADRPAAPDWGVGRYEDIAPQLLPAAAVVVQTAALQQGEHVLDLGCGTGNAALLAAERGARVTGVDPAQRLLDVARARATSEGTSIEFLHGDAASLPVDAGAFDVVMSVFGVIFAPDPYPAAAEMSRVLAAHGRIVLSAWVPTGAMFEVTSTAAETVRQAVGAPAPARFAWHDPEVLSALFAPHGFGIDMERHDLAFTAPSASAFLEANQGHPLAVAGQPVLERSGQADALTARLLGILERGTRTQTASV